MEITLLNVIYFELGFKGLWLAVNFNNWSGENTLDLWITWPAMIAAYLTYQLIKKWRCKK